MNKVNELINTLDTNKVKCLICEKYRDAKLFHYNNNICNMCYTTTPVSLILKKLKNDKLAIEYFKINKACLI